MCSVLFSMFFFVFFNFLFLLFKNIWFLIVLSYLTIIRLWIIIIFYHKTNRKKQHIVVKRVKRIVKSPLIILELIFQWNSVFQKLLLFLCIILVIFFIKISNLCQKKNCLILKEILKIKLIYMMDASWLFHTNVIPQYWTKS